MLAFEYYQPTKIIFGQGCFKRLGEVVQSHGRKALLVIGQRALRKLGILDKAVELIEKHVATISICEGIKPNPTSQSVTACAEKVKTEGIDVIVSIGGGSVMDAARAISLALTHPGNFWEYRLTGNKGITKIENKLIPVITVPTTAGTGSEISPAAIISGGSSKEVIVSSYMFPKVALVDPELTFSLPQDLTAQIGLDALVQSIEAFVSKNANPVSDLYAQESIRLAFENIIKAVSHGSDVLSRSNMLLAGLLSSKAINLAGVGAVHALSDPLSGRYNISHGLALSLILPEVVEHNLDSNFEKYARLGKLLGEDTDRMTSKKAAQKTLEAIEKLLVELGLTKRLRDFGITESDIEIFAPEAINPDIGCNPKELNIEDIKDIYRKAL